VRSRYKGSFGKTGSNGYSVVYSTRGKRGACALLTASGTYTTGGDAVAPSILGLKQVEYAFVVADDNAAETQAANSGGLLPQFDLSTVTAPKLKLYSAAGTEVTNGTSIAGKTFLVQLYGT
jgi:hypothetical protein